MHSLKSYNYLSSSGRNGNSAAFAINIPVRGSKCMFFSNKPFFIINLLLSMYQPKLVNMLTYARESIVKVLGPIP